MFKTLSSAVKRALGFEIASRHTDPMQLSALPFLPNPDPILRKLGKSQEVFDAIMMDAHVIGELRPLRATLLNFEWRLVAGGERPQDLQALALAESIMARPPAPGMAWSDVFWNMHEAVLRGQRIHEVVWRLDNGQQVPDQVIDRENRRFVYDVDNQLRVLTRESQVEGVPVDAYKCLVSRHMPSFANPYGVAVLSSCFWPYTFKHGGFRFFVKFCEKYGIPWAVGKYPAGTSDAMINELTERLAEMVEDAVAAIPADGSVELVSLSSSGQLPQERLIQLCNAEISKAINSQTLATEINGQGSRAAAETHRGREQDNGSADRKIVEYSMSELFAWTTEINFIDAAPPRFEFFEESEARQEWVDVFNGVRAFLDVPTAFAYDRLQIPPPIDGEPVLPRASAPAPVPLSDFAAAVVADIDPTPVSAHTEQLARDTEPSIKAMLDTIRAHVESADSLPALRDTLLASFGALESDDLVKVMQFAFAAADLSGRFDVSEAAKHNVA